MQMNAINYHYQIYPDTRSWPKSAAEAIAVQQKLREQVRLRNDFGAIDTIAGIDVSYDAKNDLACAVVVLVTFKNLEPQITTMAHAPATFPYVPGLLSFREIPAILKALGELPRKPDLLMVDGQGIAHPRRLGIAAHLGVITDLPAIGVAKSRLVGRYTEPGKRRGSATLLVDKQERIGTVLRSKENTNPLFISPGHRVDHDTALAITQECITKYRLPEPTRMADKISRMRDRRPKIK